jgi:hypothetical protein
MVTKEQNFIIGIPKIIRKKSKYTTRLNHFITKKHSKRGREKEKSYTKIRISNQG